MILDGVKEETVVKSVLDTVPVPVSLGDGQYDAVPDSSETREAADELTSDDSTESALTISAKRGVETHLVIPAKNDSRLVAAASKSKYATLLKAGVHIHEFEGGLLHAKTMTIDREIALIGSANLDRRSLDLNFEVSLLVYNGDFASELRFLQTTYIEQSTHISVDVPAQWPVSQRLWQNAVSLIAPIL